MFLLVCGTPMGAQCTTLDDPEEGAQVLRDNGEGDKAEALASWMRSAQVGDWFDAPTWWVFALSDRPARWTGEAGGN